jgi:hypothetical protein
MDHELTVWLGPAYEQMTADQLDRFAGETDRIHERFPDRDEQPERDAAMSAAVQYLLGETRPDDAGRALAAARAAVSAAMAASQQIAVMANADGMSEVSAAQATGIDRMTLRKVLGKR